MCPGVGSASKNEYQGFPLGVKAAGAWGWRPTTLVVSTWRKSVALTYPEPPWVLAACCGRDLITELWPKMFSIFKKISLWAETLAGARHCQRCYIRLDLLETFAPLSWTVKAVRLKKEVRGEIKKKERRRNKIVNDKANRNSNGVRPQVVWSEKQVVAGRQWLDWLSGQGTVRARNAGH
jgi:hypothetical protein